MKSHYPSVCYLSIDIRDLWTGDKKIKNVSKPAEILRSLAW